MTVTRTKRSVTAGGLEIRSSSDGVIIEGHASTFAQPYDMGWYSETVARGAFTKTLGENPDVRLLINHEGLPLARTTSQPKATLELSQDSSGLYTRATLDPKDPDVKRLLPKMIRGDLDQMSFSFGVVRDQWSDDHSERTLRELSLDGGDVSVVTYPANPNATVSVRSRVLATAGTEKLREIYRSIAGDKNPLSLQMRSLLESLAIDDETDEVGLTALSELVATPETEVKVKPAADGTIAPEAKPTAADIDDDLLRDRVRFALAKYATR